ncbi:MAG TPA: hypothetical protein PKX93_04305 [bacterium]|nr:hypothetical protein [bacterium]HPP11541.1 hypothetical protein [bacterium]
MDIISLVQGKCPARTEIIGYYGEPGTSRFKIMVRDQRWKYIFMANGGREQLFDLDQDADELTDMATLASETAALLRQRAISACQTSGVSAALDGDRLRIFPFQEFPRKRIYQFDRWSGVTGFPRRPKDAVFLRRGSSQ